MPTPPNETIELRAQQLDRTLATSVGWKTSALANLAMIQTPE